ncbi:hypothetical protein F8388_005938, partial [Cannabis sativa]
MAFRSLKA